MSIRQQGWKQTTPHFRRVSINRAMCLRSVQKGLKESHSSIVFSLDICKKKDLNMEQRCVQLFWKWVEKILQYHYTLCYVYLLVKPLHMKAVLLFFFVLFLVWVKKWLELLLEARWRVLKLDICTNVSVSLCVFSLCLLILSWHLMRWSLFFFFPSHSKTLDSFEVRVYFWTTGKAHVDGRWLTVGKLQTLRMLRRWNTHHGNTCYDDYDGNQVLQKIKVKKRPFLPLSPWFSRNNRTDSVDPLGEG